MRRSKTENKMLLRLFLLCIILITAVCIIIPGDVEENIPVMASMYGIKQVDRNDAVYSVCIVCTNKKNTH